MPMPARSSRMGITSPQNMQMGCSPMRATSAKYSRCTPGEVRAVDRGVRDVRRDVAFGDHVRVRAGPGVRPGPLELRLVAPRQQAPHALGVVVESDQARLEARVARVRVVDLADRRGDVHRHERFPAEARDERRHVVRVPELHDLLGAHPHVAFDVFVHRPFARQVDLRPAHARAEQVVGEVHDVLVAAAGNREVAVARLQARACRARPPAPARRPARGSRRRGTTAASRCAGAASRDGRPPGTVRTRRPGPRRRATPRRGTGGRAPRTSMFPTSAAPPGAAVSAVRRGRRGTAASRSQRPPSASIQRAMASTSAVRRPGTTTQC